MAQIIAVCNQKGGVGKTTTSVNLSAALAECGQRVLMVDMDPQGALTASWGVSINDGDITVYHLLVNENASADRCLRVVRPLLDLLPADINLSAAEFELFGALGRETVLQRVLRPLAPRYDFVVIDCPPNLGLLTINALVASTGVLIPLQCEYLAMRGLGMLLETLSRVKRKLNPRLEVIGILATMYNVRTTHAREVLEEVRSVFGNRVFNTVITTSIRFPEASLAHCPILEYAPDHPGAAAYRVLAQEVLNGRRS